MSPCQLWQADPGSARNGVKDTSSSCTYRVSLTFGIYIYHLGFSFYSCHGIVFHKRETARTGLAIFLVLNWMGKKKRNPCINWGKKTAIVLGPTQQNVKRLWSVFCVYIGRANKSALGWQENANADKNQCTPLPNPQTLASRFGSFSKQAVHIHTHMYAHFHTRRQICDTPCPYDPHAPYGQEEGRENKHTALWVTAAWQPAKPRGPRCWNNIVMVGTTLICVPTLLSCFIV